MRAYIDYLVKRVPDRETQHDKLYQKEYWVFIWSDGYTGECSLHQSQLAAIRNDS